MSQVEVVDAFPRKRKPGSETRTTQIGIERKLFMSSSTQKVQESRKRPVKACKRKLGVVDDPEDQFLLDAAVIERLGATSMKGKEKRKYNEMKLARLGVRAGPTHRLPYKEVMVTRKREKVIARKKKTKELPTSLLEQAKAKAEKRIKYRAKAPKYGLGKYDDGVLKLSRSEVSSIQSTKRGAARLSNIFK